MFDKSRWMIQIHDEKNVNLLSESLRINPLCAKLLINRGYTDIESARSFIEKSDAFLYDPYLLKDMKKATARIRKAIDCLSTHPREVDLSRAGCKSAIQMMSTDDWNYKHVPTKVYPVSMFDQAHEDLETKFGKYLKAVVDFTRDDFEPYIIE